jgi:hypothetical protein
MVAEGGNTETPAMKAGTAPDSLLVDAVSIEGQTE